MKRQQNSTRWAEGAVALMLAYMVMETVRTRRKAEFWPSVKRLLAEPWGAFTFKDFYANLALISAWTVMRERNVWRSAAWITSFATLGCLATLPYALLQLWKVGDASPARALVPR